MPLVLLPMSKYLCLFDGHWLLSANFKKYLLTYVCTKLTYIDYLGIYWDCCIMFIISTFLVVEPSNCSYIGQNTTVIGY